MSYAVFRSDDAGEWQLRGVVDASGSSFLDGDVPAEGTSVVFEVEARDASGGVLSRVACGVLPAVSLVCTSVGMPDGSWVVSLAGEVHGAEEYRVERQNSTGVWDPLGVVTLAEPEHVDASPNSQPVYRVAASAGGEDLGVYSCLEAPYSNGQDLGSDVVVPTTSTGAPGGVGSSERATFLYSAPPMPTVPAGATPYEAQDLCTSAGLYQALPAPKGTRAWTMLTVPAGGRVHIDIVSRKEVLEKGNWGAYIEMLERLPDGSVGRSMARKSYSTGYWWNTHEQRGSNMVIAENWTGRDATFYLFTEVAVTVDIGSSEGASFRIENVTIKNRAGNLISRPCDQAEAIKCAGAGGTHFFPETVTIDGDTYQRGCYEYHSCVADLRGFLGVLNDVSEWGCENDEFLNGALIVAGLAVIVIGGVIVIGAAGSLAAGAGGAVVVGGGGAVAGGGGGVAAGSAGVTGLSAYALTGGSGATATLAPVAAGATVGTDATVVLVAGAYYLTEVSDLFEVYIDSQSLQQLVNDRVRVEVVDGYLSVAGNSMIEQIMININADQYVADIPDPAAQEDLRGEIRRALSQCVVAMSADYSSLDGTSIATQVFEQHTPSYTIEGMGHNQVQVNGAWHHLCEFVPLYLVGAGTRRSGVPIREATAHIGQVLYGLPGVPQAPYIGVGATPAQLNPTLPQVQWLALNHRDYSTPKPRWYAKSPYECRGMGLVSPRSACDEFPAWATLQGGPPAAGRTQPHLWLMNFVHNSSQGSDQRAFAVNCGLAHGDLFFILPMGRSRLGSLSQTGTVPPSLRSEYIGPNCK